MQRPTSNLGSILLPLILVILITASALVFVDAWRSSSRIDDNEEEAIATLLDLQRAEQETLQRRGRYLTFDALKRDALNAPRGGMSDAFFARIADAIHEGEGFRHAGFCFLVLMVDRAGLESATTKPDLQDDFFIAYAWPEDFGESGRRVFVIDGSGTLRAWENRLPADFSYSGMDEAPPGHLAPPPEGAADYPFSLKRQGPQKTLVWKTLETEGRP